MKFSKAVAVMFAAMFLAGCPKTVEFRVVNNSGQSATVIHPKFPPLSLEDGAQFESRHRKFLQGTKNIDGFVYPYLSLEIGGERFYYMLENAYDLPSEYYTEVSASGFSAGGTIISFELKPDLQLYWRIRQRGGDFVAAEPQPPGFPIAPIDEPFR